jgi:hypothetical protein
MLLLTVVIIDLELIRSHKCRTNDHITWINVHVGYTCTSARSDTSYLRGAGHVNIRNLSIGLVEAARLKIVFGNIWSPSANVHVLWEIHASLLPVRPYASRGLVHVATQYYCIIVPGFNRQWIILSPRLVAKAWLTCVYNTCLAT